MGLGIGVKCVRQKAFQRLGRHAALWLSGSLLLAIPLGAFHGPVGSDLPNFDLRRGPHQEQTAPWPAQAQARDRLGLQLHGLQVSFDPILGTPRWVGSPRGFLTRPQPEDRGNGSRLVHAFLEEHRDLFGHGAEVVENIEPTRAFETTHNGMRTLVWEQSLEGIPIFQSRLVAHVTRRGELINLSSTWLAGAEAEAAADLNRPPGQGPGPTGLSSPGAAALAARNVGWELSESDLEEEPGGKGHGPYQRFRARGTVVDPLQARLVWLPWSGKRLRLCYEVILTHPERGESFRVLVDARSRQVQLRQGLTQYLEEASYRVFAGESPSPFSPGHETPLTNQPPVVPRALVTLSGLSTNSSPTGWIPPGTNTTVGNNVLAQLDRNGDNQPDLPRPQGTPARVFDLPLDLTRAPTNHGPASVVQLFYWCNWAHDVLYDLGFTEASGNFQQDNFGRGGLGNDPLWADAQDGADLNNANMTTFGDGTPPRLQMFLFTDPSPDRDGALDAEVVVHEYVHGLSNRRVGGGQALFSLQSSGLAEGWSDFYALALLSEEGDDLHGNYPFAAYASYGLAGLNQNYYFGIRRYPYSTDLTKNPLTFKDLDPTQADPHLEVARSPGAPGGPTQVHRQGEIWCSTLWEARANLIEKYGFGDGNRLMLQLVTDGMTLTPPEPSFLEARDAILQADLVNHDGANQEELWAGFAKRGMGFSATSPSSSTTSGIREAFDVPDPLSVVPAIPWVAAGPAGGPFMPPSASFQLFNQQTNELEWTATAEADWLALAPGSGTLPPGATGQTLTFSLLPEADYLPAGLYQTVVSIINLSSGRTHERTVQLRVDQPDAFTEKFDSHPFDLAYTTVTWTPDGSASYYRACRESALAFPVPPEGGQKLFLADDGFATVTLPGNTQVHFYGRSTNRFYVGSNGYLTFDQGDSTVETSLDRHFSLPRIAALFTDLDPTAGGEISWKALADRAVVSYQRIPLYRNPATNSFQIELFFDGSLRITWLNIGALSGVAGLSQGHGLPQGFQETDLSQLASCSRRLLLTIPPRVTEGEGVLTNAGQLVFLPPLETEQQVILRASQPAQLILPGPLTIPAGQSNLFFDLAAADDAQWDGSQRVHLVAESPGYASAVATLEVEDNEPGTLQLMLPAQTREGDEPLTGTVSLAQDAPLPLRIRLGTSHPVELTVPAEIVVPTRARVATFEAAVQDDQRIDGSVVVRVRAEVANWQSGLADVTVQDNETLELSLQAPPLVNEAAGFRPGVAQVRLTGSLDTNLSVALSSSAPARLAVPERVTVAAGQRSAPIDFTLSNNSFVEGTQTVTLTASALGWSNGVIQVQVVDDEIPPPPSQPIPADGSTDLSVATDLGWILEEAGLTAGLPATFSIYLGFTPELGPEHLLGTTTNLSWELSGLAPLTTYYWQVIASRAAPQAGPVWQFTTEGVDRFRWDPLPPGLRVHEPFGATLSALDAHGTIVSNFPGPVALKAVVDAGSAGPQILISELNPGTPDGVELVNASHAVVDLTDWRIWVYDNNRWPEPLLSFKIPPGYKASPGSVFQLLENGEAPGAFPAFYTGANISWTHDTSGNPVAVLVQDASGAIVDFACAGDALPGEISLPVSIPSAQWTGAPMAATADSSMTYQRVGGTDQNNQADWTLAPASPGTVHSNLLIPFSSSLRELTMTPAETDGFAAGQWSGPITLHEPATGVRLRAQDQDGHVGLSDPFPVLLSNDVTVAASAAPGPVVLGSNLVYEIRVFNAGPETATGLRLTNLFSPWVRVETVQANLGSLTVSNGLMICTVPALASQSNLVVTMSATVLATGNLTNEVTLNRDQADPNPANDRARVVTPAVPVPLIGVSDALTIEGDAGPSDLAFVLSLPGPMAHRIQVDYWTEGGTAEAGLDFAAVSGTAVFAPGEVRQSVVVPVYPDLLPEGNETLFLRMTNVTGALLMQTTALGTILNDDPLPGLLVGDAMVMEGEVPNAKATFDITLSRASGLPVSVRYGTLEVSAQAGVDYETTLGVLEFPPGVTNRTVAVPVWNDPWDEDEEIFYLSLNNPTNAVILHSPGRGTIVDDDPLPVLAVSDAFAREGQAEDGAAKFFATLTPASGRTVTVTYRTVDETARAGEDYLAGVNKLEFAPGISNQVVAIPILDDEEVEPDETFLLELENPTHAVLGRQPGRGTILNDDTLNGRLDRLVWGSLPASAPYEQPFPATIQGLDPFGQPASSFHGLAHLQAFEGGYQSSTLLPPPSPPLLSAQGYATIGYAFTPETNLLVTHVRHFFGTKVSLWNEAGDLLGTAAVDGPTGSWTETELDQPVALQAHHRYRVGALAEDSVFYWQTNSPSRFPHGTIDYSVFWRGDQFPLSGDSARWYLVDLRYRAGAVARIPLQPQVTSPFTNGLWAGSLRVGIPSPELYFWAEDDRGHTGVSTPVRVVASHDLAVRLTAAPLPAITGQVLAYDAETTNGGSDPATNVVMNLELPDSAGLVFGFSSQGTLQISGTSVRAELGNLPAGESAYIHLEVIPDVAGATLRAAALCLPRPQETWTNNNQAVLTTEVLPPVILLVPPQNLTVMEGAPAALTVRAQGAGPLAYQWWKDAQPLPGATHAVLSWAQAAQSLEGDYHVVVSQADYRATSQVARLTVNAPLTGPGSAFANVLLPPGYSMLANPLPQLDNRIATVLASPPPGATVIKTHQGGFAVNNYLNQWTDPDMPLPPGEAFWIKNPNTNSWLLSFSGKVLTGPMTNWIPAGLAICSSLKAGQGYLSTALGFPARPGNRFFRYDQILGTFRAYEYDGPGWFPEEPRLSYGEGFAVRTAQPAAWSQAPHTNLASPAFEVHPNPVDQTVGSVNFFTYHPDPNLGQVRRAHSLIPLDDEFLGQLYGGLEPAESELEPLGEPVFFNNGYVRGGLVSVPGSGAGQRVFVQLRVWHAPRGASYEAAQAQGGAHGRSALMVLPAGAARVGERPGLPPPDTHLFASFTVEIPGTNTPPTLAPLADLLLHAQTTISFTNQASDAETAPENLRYSLLAGPATAFCHPTNGWFTWTADETDIGTTNEVVIEVIDDGMPPMTAEQRFQVVVLPRPMLEADLTGPGRVVLSWAAVPGTTYQLQYKENLNDPAWIILPETVTATNLLGTLEHLMGEATQGFYRILVVP